MDIIIKDKFDNILSLYIKSINKFDKNNLYIFKKYQKEIKSIKQICYYFELYKKCYDELLSLNELMLDEEYYNLANEEFLIKKKQLLNLEKNIFSLFNDNEKECILEIRIGTGGDESCMFVKDLYNLYIKYITLNKFEFKILDLNLFNNGFKYVIIKIYGPHCYDKFKYESGCHRVQRVPISESQGRIHTSTCVVAVIKSSVIKKMPEINFNDIKIDTFKSSGAGGQHVNTTDSAVRVKHLPSGIVVECQDERSQHKNKSKALDILKIRLRNYEELKIKKTMSETKKKLLGKGDRSSKNRTYNFIQNRVTDHRINISISLNNLFESGNLDLIIKNFKNNDIIEVLDYYKSILQKNFL